MFNLNFDGSFHDNQGGAIWFILRDHDGHLIVADSKIFSSTSIIMTEFQGAWEGLTSAIYYLHCKDLILEGNFATIIS